VVEDAKNRCAEPGCVRPNLLVEYAKVNGNPSSGCANLVNPSWQPIDDPKATVDLMGATAWTDSFVWTIPPTPTGYYCVRGTVSDTASQLTSAVNRFGMR
jgi:hypothetical protein